MKALVLAGGFPQISLIEEIKRRGIYCILADYFENPVAKEYADKFYQESTLDVDAIREIAEKEKVDFIITACTDQALVTMAFVSEQLGLPCYIDYQTALNVTNKSYMKEVFSNNNIPTSKYKIIQKLEISEIIDMKYPLIVKPVDCNSSKGVRKVYNFDELEEAYDYAKRISRTSNVVIEEYVDGQEITIDIMVQDGKVYLLSVANSDKVSNSDKFVIWRTRYPADETTENLKKVILDVGQRIADAFKIKNSPMLIQMITDGVNVSVLEFSARTGGGVKPMLIKKVSGFDVISTLIDLTLGIKFDVEISKPESKYLTNIFIYCNSGIFDRLEGFEELKKEGIISEYYQFRSRGVELANIENSGDRIAGFTIQGNEIDEMKSKYEKAIKSITVLDENGKDIICRSIYTEWYTKFE